MYIVCKLIVLNTKHKTNYLNGDALSFMHIDQLFVAATGIIFAFGQCILTVSHSNVALTIFILGQLFVTRDHEMILTLTLI